jgi:hypothetical protein
MLYVLSVLLSARYGTGFNSFCGAGHWNDSNASSVMTHGEIDVEKFFPFSGPSGIISNP